MSEPSFPAKKPMTYADAGVDVTAGYRVVEMIRGAVESTRRAEVMSGLGGFGALFKPNLTGYQEPVLVSATDGVGTKLKLAFLTGIHHTVGLDLVAMSVNDLVVQGAEPLFFLDYFATGKLHPDIAATVIQGIAQGCLEAGCSLIGGETAEMPDFYAPGEYDLAGFAVGLVERSRIIDGHAIAPGDVVVGLAASGPHSNGYSLIRKLVLGPDGPGLSAPFADTTLGQALLTPTRIYVKPILALAQSLTVKGLIHITGGGYYENIPRILPSGTAVHLHQSRWPRPPIFAYLQELGALSEEVMLGTFNCGIGMMAILPAAQGAQAVTLLKQAGETAYLIGEVKAQEPGQAQVVIHG